MIRKPLALMVLAALALPVTAHAAAFDVEAASRAYFDLLQGPAREKSDAYFEGGYWLILWGAVASIFVDWLILRAGIIARIRDWAERKTARPNLRVWLTGLGYILVAAVLILPWTIYTGFIREAQYGLMNQALGEWLADQGKDLAIDLAFVPLLLIGIYAAIRRFPARWWLLGTGLASLGLLLMVVIAPVFLAPMFNTYTELPQGPVRERIVSLAKANGIPSDHIYLFDASKQTKKISANVSGLGPTIRISLNDNLLNRTSEPEIAAVMGHEMGHYVLDHVFKLFLALTAVIGVAFWAASRIAPWLIARYGTRWGVRDMTDPASMPVVFIALSIVALLMTPVLNNIVRWNENEADAFGLDAAKEPDGFAMAAMRLSEYRKIHPGAVEEFLFYDHPSGETRVRRAMEWKAKHVPDATIVKPQPLPVEALSAETKGR